MSDETFEGPACFERIENTVRAMVYAGPASDTLDALTSWLATEGIAARVLDDGDLMVRDARGHIAYARPGCWITCERKGRARAFTAEVFTRTFAAAPVPRPVLRAVS